jgi:hypothetical protein
MTTIQRIAIALALAAGGGCADIGLSGDTCGDGTCAAGEDCLTCAADCPCGAGTACTDGHCEAACGDGVCLDPYEDCDECPADCTCGPGTCGDGTCDWFEDCGGCVADCACGADATCVESSCEPITCGALPCNEAELGCIDCPL